ncbi:MAG TPA: hypothetical protein VD968_06110 [Pyrinomonadaceae bacterium]|nr:hypothetical protein [Pyrinomonadaceae bacterium]
MAKMIVKRVGVFSLAKLQAVIGVGLGLVIGIPLGLIMIIFGAAIMSGGSSSATGGGISVGIIGLFYMIGLPIMYGVIGFIGGAITALIYNVASGVLGGLELELENADTGYTAPPPPSQWGAGQYEPGQQQQYPY